AFDTQPGAIPLLISVHVFPPSCVLKKCGFMSSSLSVFAAMYAVFVSKCPASRLKMRVHGLTSFGVTSFHFAPPFIVTCTSPSPVPAHRTFTSSGDGDSAVTVPSADAFTSLAYLPAFDGMSHFSARVRAPLIAVHDFPPFVVFHTPADA